MNFFKSDNFEPHVRDLLERHRIPGLAIALIQNDEIASAGFGSASINPPKPCTADTLFDIASASKSLTGASVALLVEDDDKYPEVQYNGIMSEMLPGDFVLSERTYHEGVTLDDVLGHRTGMSPHDYSYMSTRAQEPDDAKSVTRNWRNLVPSAPIRSKYMYSDMMFTTATYLVEKKTGQRFDDYLQETFFTPLGMESTNLQPKLAREKGLSDRIATGYVWDVSSKSFRAFQSPDRPEGQGAGSIITSVNDYIKWVKTMMNKEAPLNEDIYAEMIRSRTFIETEHNPKWLGPYTSQTIAGAGLETMYYRGHLVVVHNGITQGFASRHFFLPEFKFGAVILANASAAGRIIEILSRELIDDAINVPEAQRHGWTDAIALKRAEDGDAAMEKRQKRMRDGVLQELCPNGEAVETLTLPLEAYIGKYWNKGYRGITVEVRDGGLYVDATDRSVGFTATFEHVRGQTKFIAHLCDFLEGGDTPIRAEFVVEDGKAVKMGLQLEDEECDLIWFDTVQQD